jgi:hypothetical protein
MRQKASKIVKNLVKMLEIIQKIWYNIKKRQKIVKKPHKKYCKY